MSLLDKPEDGETCVGVTRLVTSTTPAEMHST